MFPYVLVAPAYFAEQDAARRHDADRIRVFQRAGSLSFFITVYRQLAEWRAVVNRLDGFEAGLRSRAAAATPKPADHVARRAGAVAIAGPGAATCRTARRWSRPSFSFRQGERTLISGPSGSGKSTLFRAIAGIWPFGDAA